MSQKHLIRQLKELGEVKPSTLFKEQTKQYVLSVSSSQETSFEFFIKYFRPIKSWVSPVMITSLTGFFVFVGSFGVIHASQQSLPGSLLYDVKLTTEKVKSAFVVDPDKKTQLEIHYANTRVQELHTLATRQEVNPNHVKKAIVEYKQSIQTLQNQFDRPAYQEHEKALRFAKMIDDTKEQFDQTVKEVKKHVNTGEREISKHIKEVQENTEQIRSKAMAVIMKDYQQANEKREKMKESVNALINEKIENAQMRLNQLEESGITTATLEDKLKLIVKPDIKEEDDESDENRQEDIEETNISVQDVKRQLEEVKELFKDGQELPDVLVKLEKAQKNLKELENTIEFAEIKPLHEDKQEEERDKSVEEESKEELDENREHENQVKNETER